MLDVGTVQIFSMKFWMGQWDGRKWGHAIYKVIEDTKNGVF
jgi:hypothetical protein